MLLLGLPPPDLQVTLSRGGTRYRADLVVHEFRTVVEVDGKVKYEGPEQAWRDKRRRDDFLSWGYEVERFVAADAHHAERWGRKVLECFGRACRRHGLSAPAIDPVFPGYRLLPTAWRVNGS
jgi:hypothetical protein